MESLRLAVEAWFESCIDRGVLKEALREAGFSSVPNGIEGSISHAYIAAL